MKAEIGPEDTEAEALLPPTQKDGSGIGVNYADQYIKVFKKELEDGRKVACRRRGLKLTLSIGDQKGEGLMRRLDHGPDEKTILRKALEDAAQDAGATLVVEDGVIYLDC